MTAPDLERRHQALVELIGRRGPRVEATAARRDIARFALAAGETGHDAGVAHPLMLSSTLEWGAGSSVSDLRADGTGTAGEGWLPLDGLRIMGGGQELEFHAAVAAGTTFVAEPALEAVELKRGGSGDLLLLTIATEYRDAVYDEPLLTCRETLIAR